MNTKSVGINFCARVPKIKPAKVKRPDFFRDSELFNPKKDRLTHDYFRYEVDDNSAGINKLFDDFDFSENARTGYCNSLPAYDELVYLYQKGDIFESSELPNIFEKIK